MYIPTFSRLKDALEFATAESNDSYKYVIASDATVGKHKFKKYHVGYLVEIYNFLSYHDVSAYEVIRRKNVFLYLDIEISNTFPTAGQSSTILMDACLTEEGYEGDFSEMLDLLGRVYDSLAEHKLNDREMGEIGELMLFLTKEFVELVFKKSLNDQKVDIYTACRESKLSFHFVHR